LSDKEEDDEFAEPDTVVEEHPLCPRCGSPMFDDGGKGGEFVTMRCSSCRYGKMTLREKPRER
jgi:hypothetical protein